jgi:hypothetical protein
MKNTLGKTHGYLAEDGRRTGYTEGKEGVRYVTRDVGIGTSTHSDW